jgi:1-acyl-sn-glycerol-3-phosphate acyltransferase
MATNHKLELLQAAMKDRKDPITFFILSVLVKIVVFFRFRPLRVIGGENLPTSGPYICIANHSSRWDGPTLGRLIDRPANFMVSPNELTGLQGFLLSRVGAFPAHPRLDFVSHVLGQFKKGEPFVIFPEGNVFYDGHTHAFKKGLSRIAFAAYQNGFDVPIVPVAIRYENGMAKYNVGKPIAVSDYLRDIGASAEAVTPAIQNSFVKAMHRELCALSAENGNVADARQMSELQAPNQFMEIGVSDLNTSGSLNVPGSSPLPSRAAVRS